MEGRDGGKEGKERKRGREKEGKTVKKKKLDHLLTPQTRIDSK